MRGYRDLRVWQEGMGLARDVYVIARALPVTERFGLASQLQRTCVSVPSNIAEGYARESTADFVRYLCIASGSLAELETQLQLTRELGLHERSAIDRALQRSRRLSRMLITLRTRLRARRGGPPAPG